MADTYQAIESSIPSSPVLHPLEPLTAEEITAAVRIVRTERSLHERVRFASVTLHEPPKEVVLNFKQGDPITRAAFIILLDNTDGATYEAIVLGILVFGAFSVFWVTLSFILETPPYHYGSDVVGLFGLVGIAGALAALFVGRFADRRDARYANGVALAVILLSFIVMWLTGQKLLGLIIGAFLLDLGAQSNQAANEARIYTLNPAAWNRLNTLYILMFCLGGSLGSVLGAFSWSIARWNGVYGIACFMLLVALGFYVLHGKRIRQWRASSMAFTSYPDEEMQLGA